MNIKELLAVHQNEYAVHRIIIALSQGLTPAITSLSQGLPCVITALSHMPQRLSHLSRRLSHMLLPDKPRHTEQMYSAAGVAA
jgi:hypothetical protein